MPKTKKLEKLLLKYKKANRARLTAYAKRSRLLHGVWDNEQKKLVFKVPITPELKAELNANIEVARLYKLEVSKELRAYCKKKKYHIKWDSNNGIKRVQEHLAWKLRTCRCSHDPNFFLKILYKLNLTTSQHFCF